MALARHVFGPGPAGPRARQGVGPQRRLGPLVLSRAFATIRRAPELGGLIVLAALLNLWALGRNDWANTYYAAAVRSMASSWHNFLYVSFDPGGVTTVDKPPLSLWVQSLSVRVFGFHPLSILVPQALIGVASVVLVYDLVRRRFGRLGGFVAGIALATTPIAVAMSRDNNPDALLTLLCVAAIWFALRAFEDGRTRWLILSGVAVGLAFETKMLVALVVVPAIVIAWLWIAPRGRGAAVRQLLAGGAAMFAVGLAWPVLVMLTPSGERPWIAGTADNSVWSLIFGYNGLGRVSGQAGGPGGPGGGLGTAPSLAGSPGTGLFGGATGPFRLLNSALGGQGGWLLGIAVVGAVIVLVAARARRRDPRTAWIVLVGGSFVVTAVLFSVAHGIFHAYYVVLLAPFTAALVGAGVATVARGEVPPAFAGTAALAVGALCELVVLRAYPGELAWLNVVVPAACTLAALGLFVSTRWQGRALAITAGTAALLIAPAAWAFDTLGYATQPTFPAGGPAALASTTGGVGGNGGPGPGGAFSPLGGPPAGGLRGSRGPFAGSAGGALTPLFGGALEGVLSLSAAEHYVAGHGGGTIAISAQSGPAAAAIIATGARIAGIGGFTGNESDPTISWLAGEVASGRIRWALIDSGFAAPGLGNRPGARVALNAAARACAPVSAVASLYDCAGKAAALRAVTG